jgi:hypothetical protein
MLAFLGSQFNASLRPKAKLNVLFRQYLAPTSLRHFYRIAGAGILTCYPSDAPFGYSLGPGLP